MTVQSNPSAFVDRHIGARRQADIDTMLKAIGYDSVDGLVDTAVPDSIRQESPLNLDSALSEVEVLAELRRLASKNRMAVQMTGRRPDPRRAPGPAGRHRQRDQRDLRRHRRAPGPGGFARV